MAEYILPGTGTDPTQRVQDAIGDLLPPTDQKEYGVIPDGWNRLMARPEVGGSLALLYTADNLRAKLRGMLMRDVSYEMVLQTSAEGPPRMYQEASLEASVLLRRLIETPSMRTLKFGVAATLPEAVTHARLVLTHPGNSTPLMTMHEGWGVEPPYDYPFVDMTSLPFVAHATGSPH
jgi:hypothetical protein